MKDRDVKMRQKIKASEVKQHDVVELAGQRLRVDRRRKQRNGRIKLTEITPGRRRVRGAELSAAKKLDLVRR